MPGTTRDVILVYGTVCLDRLRKVGHLPVKGGYVEVDDEVELLGGEAANTAVALHQWGADFRLAGNPIGDDASADRLAELLREAGIPEPQVARHAGPAPVCDIYVTPDGDRTMFGRGFRAMDQSSRPLEVAFEAGEWFTAEPNHGASAREAVRLATAAGMQIYLLDFTRSDEPIPPGSVWQSSTDWAGTRGDIQRNVRWVQEWTNRYGCRTILSDGPNGFVAATPDLPARHYPPFPCPQMVDSTGAGDIFRAAMLHALDQDLDWVTCLRSAAVAGCLNCQGLGANTAIPTWNEIAAYISLHPVVAAAY